MNERLLRAATEVVAVTGAAIAGYVLVVRETGATIACATGGCETVQSSPYSEIFGLPVAALGLAAYLTMLVLGFARGELAGAALASLALAGVVFGSYLLYVQVEVVGAVCDWCVASDVVMSLLAVLALLRLRSGSVILEEQR